MIFQISRTVNSVLRIISRQPKHRKVTDSFPYPVSVPKNCVIFIGCNFESRATQVGLHKQKKDTASAKKGKVSLQRRGGQRLKAVLLI